MSSNSSQKKNPARRRRWIQFGAILAAVALVMMTVLSIPAMDASADERSDAVQRLNESRSKVDGLQDKVEGIDAELASLFRQMEQTKIDVATAQIELVDTEAELAEAQRNLTTARAELQEAQRELDELTTAVGVSQSNEGTLTAAVGDMARELYRGKSTSTMQVVMSAEGTAEINSRASAASSLGRVQSKALDEVRSSLVVQENQQERQTAITERIAVLEAEAEAAAEAAEGAKAIVEDKLDALEELQVTQSQAEAEWNARKSEAEAQLASYDAAGAQAASDIARIDGENATNQTVFESGGGSASASSGGVFGNPFSFSAPVTSNYGWRVHPIFGTPRLHDGTDFGAACGTPLLATRAGQVTSAGWLDGLGNQVTINHGLVNGSSMVTRSGHMQSIAVSAGQSVSRGQIIGYTGTTGNSTGCHLHLSLFVNGSSTSILGYM
jgi:murein DD-endopeptidase MepM/ murein hydrolase activator NlpD